MSKEVFEVDESQWELYLTDCQLNELTPTMSDFLVWCDENDIERPEVWDGPTQEENDVA